MEFLEFEKPIIEMETKIEELRQMGGVDVLEEIEALEKKCDTLKAKIFSSLSDVEIANLGRHPKRPYSLDYFSLMLDEFTELHGDRAFGDDKAIIGGLAKIDGIAVMVIGHQKGRSTKEKIVHNFGMPRPEGYRKALRLMKLAERFNLPILTFVDTPGAYPGIDAEERGQSEAIARNLIEMAELKVPIICTIIGEGGSGGALAIGVGDLTCMLQFSTYSVISPEGCASILWKNADKANKAASAMGITANKLKELNLIEEIIEEPLGGAHRDYQQTANAIKATLVEQIKKLQGINKNQLLETRYQKYMNFGIFNEKTA